MTPGIVPMIAPDGSTGDIPVDRAHEAAAAGFKPAVVMTSPDGKMGYIPRDRVGDAVKAGFKAGQPLKGIDYDVAEKQGFFKHAGKEVANIVGGMATMVGDAISNPVAAGVRTAATMGPQIYSDDQARKADNRSLPYRAVAAAGTPLGINAAGMEEAAAQGDTAGVFGTAVGDAIPYVAPSLAGRAIPKAVKAVSEARPLEGVLASKMNEVPPGGKFTRAEMMEEARTHGVNLDVAQATDSGIASAAKRANQYSVAAQSEYKANAVKNLNALDGWANEQTSQYSPVNEPKDVLGPKLQEALKNHLETRQGEATQLYGELDQNVGNATPDASTVYEKAREIVAENKEYYDKNPALKQSRAWQIVNDLAKRGAPVAEVKPATTVEGLETFRPDTPKAAKAAPKPDTWTDLQKLRTDLMSEYRSADIVGTRAEGWLKQLAAAADDSMTGAGSGLKGPDLANFRAANKIWDGIKNTYDNPQHPLYHAVRAQFPSQVPDMLSGGAPELAGQVREVLGSLEGPFQRKFVEKLLYAKDGQTLELGRLPQKLKGMSSEHLEAMLGQEGADQLRMLAEVAKKVNADANPSGTAKIGQPAAEVGALFTHPVAGAAELATQYVAGKAMNSPRVVDYLTRARERSGITPDPETGRMVRTPPPEEPPPAAPPQSSGGGGNYTPDELAALKATHGLTDNPNEQYGAAQAQERSGLMRDPNTGRMNRLVPGSFANMATEAPPRAGTVGSMLTDAIKQDPHRFQYKLNTDAEGVGTLLKEQDKYNPALAGVISVWEDPATGETYVVNGHHRLELAKRTGQSEVNVMHIVADTEKAARAMGALQNISEGRGTPVDAAKFMRDAGITLDELKKNGISLGEATAAKGFALSKLDPSLFAKVHQGEMSVDRAVTIADSTADHAEQRAIVDLVDKKETSGRHVTSGQLAELIRFAKESGKTTETTGSLFGEETVARSLAWEKSEISDYIKKQLGKDKKMFGFVSKDSRATELERGNNIIDVDASKKLAESAAQGEAIYEKLSGRAGPIADILDDAAERLANGESANGLKQEAYDQILRELRSTIPGGEGPSVSGSKTAATGGKTAQRASREASISGPDDKANYPRGARRGDPDWASGGLDADQLSAWSKSKSLTLEPAGEQGALFGAPVKLYRATRIGSDGMPERALITQPQIDKLVAAGNKNIANALRKDTGMFEAGDLGEIIGRVRR